MIDKNNTPQIRFAGFSEKWVKKKLEDFLIQYNEVTTRNNQYPVLTSSRKGIFFQTDYYDGHQIASEDNTGYNIVPRGYFTYRHMSDDEVFHFNINDIAEFGIVSTLYPVFTTTHDLNSKFLQYKLNYGKEFPRYAVLQKQGGSRTYMYFNKLKNLHLLLPSTLDEQASISDFLVCVDTYISQHQSKLEKLRNLKVSMLEKMFPSNGATIPEVRFKEFRGPWETHPLSHYLETSSEKNSQNHYAKEDVLSVSGEFGVVNQIKHLGRSYAGNVVKGYGIAKCGDVIYTKSPLKEAPYGIIKTNLGNSGIVSALYAVYHPKESIYSPFVQTYFELDQRLNNYLRPIISKGAKNTINVGDEAALLGTVCFPTYEEQKAIHNYFSTLSALILQVEQEIEKLKSFKKGLLEKMFV